MNPTTPLDKKGNIVRWVLCAIYLIVVIAFAGKVGFGTGFVATFGTVFLFMHGIKRYGLKSTFVFVAFAYVISTILEDCSIHFGFPFGNYHYNAEYILVEPNPFNQGMLPWIDQVPFQVGIMYIAMAYYSWSIACVILNHADYHLDKRVNRIALPAVGAAIMAQFDLVQDPVTSTYESIYIWEDGGGVFGVPLVNFLGWWLAAFIIMFCFTQYLARNPKTMRNTAEIQTKGFWAQPIILYFLVGFSYICQYIYQLTNNAGAIAADLRGVNWSVLDLHENAVTVMVFTMLYSCVLAVIQLFKNDPIRLTENP